MTTDEEQRKKQITAIYIKCAVCVVPPVLMTCLFLSYPQTIAAGFLALLGVVWQALISATVVVYAMYQWGWLPAALAATLLALHLWLSCVCASMKKKHLYGMHLFKLERNRDRIKWFSAMAALLYASVSTEPVIAWAFSSIYSGFVFLYWAHIKIEGFAFDRS